MSEGSVHSIRMDMGGHRVVTAEVAEIAGKKGNKNSVFSKKELKLTTDSPCEISISRGKHGYSQINKMKVIL